MAIVFDEFPFGEFRELQMRYRSMERDEALYGREASPPSGPWERSIEGLHPHLQFSIDLKGLRSERPIENAFAQGWRHLLWSESGRLGAVLFGPVDGGRKPTFIHFNVGPFVPLTVQGFDQASRRIANGAYRFRFLFIPQVYVAAIWLRGDGDGLNDYFIPLSAPTNPGGSANESAKSDDLTLLEEKEFFETMAQRIEMAERNAPPPHEKQG